MMLLFFQGSFLAKRLEKNGLSSLLVKSTLEYVRNLGFEYPLQ